MLLGILSDTHNQIPRLRQAIEMLRANGAEALVHCGDLTERKVVSACAVLPCFFVFGNNDSDNVSALKDAMAGCGAVCLGWGGEVTVAGKRVAVTHGHMGKDVGRLLSAQPDYLLSGHSHQARDWREGTTRRINPGALYRATEFTVALLDLETDELQFLTVPR
jgi:putative phosphoesterase